jgi:hypothetical protein
MYIFKPVVWLFIIKTQHTSTVNIYIYVKKKCIYFGYELGVPKKVWTCGLASLVRLKLRWLELI